MVEVVVVGTKEEEEKLISTMNTKNTVGDAAHADDDGKEKVTVAVVIEAAAAAGTTKVLVDEEKKLKMKAAAAGDHPSVTVDGKKLKAWLKQLIMWSCVYFLLYWIRMVMIKNVYYGVAIFLHGIIAFPVAFFGMLVTGGVDTVNKINSLVLLVNNNIIPSPQTFKSSTTGIDQMKKEIRDSLVCLLLCSFVFNFIHMITILFSKIILEFIGSMNEVGGLSAKADDHWYFQVLFAGCIFLVTLLHTAWYDHTICEELGLESPFHMKQSATHKASINQPHTDNTTNSNLV